MIPSDIELIILYANLVAHLGLLILMWRKETEAWHRLLVVLSLAVSAGIILNVLETLGYLTIIRDSTLKRIPFYILLLIAADYCFITFAFTRSPIRRLWWSIITLLWLFGIPMVLELPVSIGYITKFSVLKNEVILVGWGFFISVSIIHMIIAYRRAVYPLHRNRYKYWFLVTVVIVIGSGLLYFGQSSTGFSLFTIATLLLSLASLSHELPDVRQIFKRTTAYLLTTLLSVTVYAGTMFLFNSIYGRSDPGLSALLSVILASALVILANPLINIFYRWVSGQISGSALNGSRLLGNYSKDISNIIQINHLAWEIIHKITTGMQIEYGELFTIENHGDCYQLNLVKRGSAETKVGEQSLRLDANSPIVKWLSIDKRSITQYDLDFHPKLSATGKDDITWISNNKMDILVPIYSQDEWIGLLAFGPKLNGDRFYDEEINLLQALADQTAVGLRNARLYDDVKHQNAQNEKLNIELSAANEELARLDQAKSDFISIASHEIRTPLTQIIGYNDILGDMVKSGNIPRTAGVQMADGVRKAARRLEEIVDTMFDVSMLDTRTLDLHYTYISLYEVINQALEKWMKPIEDRNLIFTVKGTLLDLPTIRADGRRLKQVFSNLIQNAIKYTPDGGQIQVTGTLLQRDHKDGGPIVAIEISDSGIGIGHEDIDRVFEKFYRVGNVMLHSSGETKFKGAGPGLGLTIARGIVEAHGGKIWAESPGNDDSACPGSTFHIHLPVEATAVN